MRHFLANIISCAVTFVKLSVLKLFHFHTLSFHPVVRFSPNFRFSVMGKSRAVIGKKVIARSGVKLIANAGGELTIGDHSGFGYYSIVVCRHKISIGNHVYIGPNVLIYDHDHTFRTENGVVAKGFECAPVSIGDHTWIGANTVILRGSTIGKGCVIGAGSVVKGHVPDHTILVQKRETILSEIKTAGELHDE